MATQAQILANQQNSQLSTGPRTVAGKAVSCHNNYAHGCFAGRLIFESPEQEVAFLQFHQGFVKDYKPFGSTEEEHVYHIARASWLKLNIDFEETEYEVFLKQQWTAEAAQAAVSPAEPAAPQMPVSIRLLAARAGDANFKALDRRARKVQSLLRFHMKELFRLQAERKAAEVRNDPAYQLIQAANAKKDKIFADFEFEMAEMARTFPKRI